MAELKFDISAYDLDEVYVDCPYRVSELGGYGYGHHKHLDTMPEGYPCYYSDRGPTLLALVKWTAETVARLDRQLNPPPPKPEPKKRTPRKKTA